MQDINSTVELMNRDGLSNRAIARATGLRREEVKRRLRAMNRSTPFPRPQPQWVTGEGALARGFSRGEVYAFFTGGDEDIALSLRAVVLEQYEHHVCCAIQMERGKGWETVYRECFAAKRR